jgi:sodium/bile acid cotransporter 7
MASLLRKNWFVISLLAAITLGATAPRVGEILNPAGVLSAGAVVAIFLLSGLSLPTEKLTAGVRAWRLHAVCWGFIFVICPAWFALTGRAVTAVTDDRLLLGVVALGVLPTTISSCVALTSVARGNTAGAAFNAVATNLAGVLLSPVLLSVLAGTEAGLDTEAMLSRLVSLAAKVIAPLALGQMLRRFWLGQRIETWGKAPSQISSGLIVLIVFLAFAKAARSDKLASHAHYLPWMFAYLAASNVLLMLAVWVAARTVGLTKGDRAVAVFVGPQKTLALGAPLLSSLLADRPDLLAVTMTPILFYHPWQLLTASVALRWLAPEKNAATN